MNVDLVTKSNPHLLAELSRRGTLTDLHGAVGALYDHLDANGFLDGDSELTQTLVYRLRIEDTKLNGQSSQSTLDFWHEKIRGMLPDSTIQERATPAYPVLDVGVLDRFGVIEKVTASDLLQEANRRGIFFNLHSEIVCLYAHVSEILKSYGDSNTTQYLLYRLRKEDAKTSEISDLENDKFWQEKINIHVFGF